jgi:peroxiredoxin
MRSWRYAAVVDDGVVKAWFEEPGFSDNCETDPYGESSPQNVYEKLTEEVLGEKSEAA